MNTAAAEATLTAVRHGLAAAGVKGDIEVGSYAVANAAARLCAAPELRRSSRPAPPIIAAIGRTISVPGRRPNGWENRPYYNLGCATQQTFAAQVDDPRDLVKPRAEQPGDVQMRTRAIQDLRGRHRCSEGQDPSTELTQSKLTPIGGGGQ